MKVIATVTNDLSTDQRMIRICNSLVGAGHEVLLVGRELTNSVPLINRPFQQIRFRLIFRKGKLFYLEYNLRLFFFLLFQKYDVVHAVDLDSLFPGLSASRIRGKICVYDAHEFFTELPEVIERKAIQKTWEWVAGYCIPKVDYSMTVCKSLAEIFSKKYNKPFEVIRNVPFQKLLPAQSEFSNKKPFILLYQGALNEGRGLEEIIAALPQMKSAELWLAGDGDLAVLLQKMVMEKGLENQVKFLGRLSPEQLAVLTPQAHIGLNLLKNKGLNYYYSLANKAFDYIQAGLPSLSMDFPEYQKLNSKFEVFELLADLNPGTISDSINGLISDKTAYRKMAINCRKAAKELIWEKEELKLKGFYENIEKSNKL